MLRYFKYRLPFKNPFRIFDKSFENREGIILLYKESDITAFGEVAPLPWFSAESLEQVETVLKINHANLEKVLRNKVANEILHVIDQIHDFPSLSFGIDTLIHDLAAKRARKNLAEYLFKEEYDDISVNAVLPFQSKKESLKKAGEFAAKGFTTFKLKVGQNFEEESEILSSLRNQYPQIKIRVDANQAWTAQEAIKNLQSIAPLEIEYCEQPVPKDDFAGLKKVKESSSIPIAADESVRNKKEAIELLKAEAIDVLILKPTLLGSFKNIFVTKQVAKSHNIKVVFTTTLEGMVARAAVASLASGLGSQNYAHGIATGHFFQFDIGTSKWLDESILQFPQEPGLGITIDVKTLEEIRV